MKAELAVGVGRTKRAVFWRITCPGNWVLGVWVVSYMSKQCRPSTVM